MASTRMKQTAERNSMFFSWAGGISGGSERVNWRRSRRGNASVLRGWTSSHHSRSGVPPLFSTRRDVASTFPSRLRHCRVKVGYAPIVRLASGVGDSGEEEPLIPPQPKRCALVLAYSPLTAFIMLVGAVESAGPTGDAGQIRVLLDDDFSGDKLGLFFDEVGAEAEYHYLFSHSAQRELGRLRLHLRPTIPARMEGLSHSGPAGHGSVLAQRQGQAHPPRGSCLGMTSGPTTPYHRPDHPQVHGRPGRGCLPVSERPVLLLLRGAWPQGHPEEGPARHRAL